MVYRLAAMCAALQSLLCQLNREIRRKPEAYGSMRARQRLESRLVLASAEPLCLDPSPNVLLQANRIAIEAARLNTPLVKRSFVASCCHVATFDLSYALPSPHVGHEVQAFANP